MTYCGHCLRVVALRTEPTYQCQQCPNEFGVCAKCMPLMATNHPSMHTFSKQPLSYYKTMAHDLFHLDIKCDGCSLVGFNGNRYQCEEYPLSYDLCENCFGKKHTHHKLKYIQNPFLNASNRSNLAQRAVALANTTGGNDINWRDPLTGWTKADANLIIQQATRESENQTQRLQQILKKNADIVEEERRIARQQLADTERRLQDSIEDNHRRFLWNLSL